LRQSKCHFMRPIIPSKLVSVCFVSVICVCVEGGSVSCYQVCGLVLINQLVSRHFFDCSCFNKRKTKSERLRSYFSPQIQFYLGAKWKSIWDNFELFPVCYRGTLQAFFLSPLWSETFFCILICLIRKK